MFKKETLARWDNLLPRLAGVACFFVIVAGLKLGKEIFVVLALAGLISIVLSPLVDLLRKARLPRIAAVLVVFTFSLALLGAVGYGIIGQVASIGRKLPEYRQNVRDKFIALHAPLAKGIQDVQRAVNELQQSGKPPPELKPGAGKNDPVKVEVIEASPTVFSLLAGTLIPSMSALGNAAAVLLLVLFFLLYSAEIHDRVVQLAGTSQGAVASNTISDSIHGVVHYLALQAVVNLTHGVALGLGLWAFGVPNALLWGFAGAVLRFVPYLGPVIGSLLPIGLSLAVFPGWARPLGVAGFVVVLETLSNNLLEPLVYGKRTGLSPVAIVVAAVFWAWLWDGLGLLLSIPLTVCLFALGKHIRSLNFLEVLLGGAPVMEPREQIYLRLLSNQISEASALFDREGGGKSLVQRFDDLLIPVLRMVETDRRDGKIDDEKAEEVLEAIGDMAEGDAPLPAAEPGAATILCLPASDGTDHLAAAMLARVLGEDRLRARALSASSLAGEKLEAIGQEGADIVVLSTLPPSNILKARYLYKRLRSRFPDLPIVVGIWGAQDQTVLEGRIARDGKAPVVSSLAAARLKLRELAEAATLRKADTVAHARP